MKVFANFALLFGTIGFVGYLFIIVAGFFGCCVGLTSIIFHKILIVVLIVAVISFALCMYNNCCASAKKDELGEQ